MLFGPRPSIRASVLLVAVLGGGLLLRLWAIGHGLPFALVDEPEIIDRAIAIMKTGDFNPHFWDYPALYIYVQALVACIRFLTGAMTGQWSSLAASHAADYYLWARVSTACVGTGIVYATYRVALRWGERPAVLAAAVVAVQPLLAREAHFALTDTPMTLLVVLTALASLRAAERGRTRDFVLAGLTAGLAAATKYNGAVALVMPVTVAVLSPAVAIPAAGAAAAAVGASVVGFLVGAPYSVLDLPAFLNGFASMLSNYSHGRTLLDGLVLYTKYVRNSFGLGGTPGAWLSGPGLIAAAWGALVLAGQSVRRSTRARSAPMIVFAAAYFWFISRNAGLVYARYALPALPFLALFIGVGTSAALARIGAGMAPGRRRTAAAAAVLVIVLGPGLWQAVGWDRLTAQVSSNELAYRWIRAYIPAGSVVESDTLMLRLPDPDYTWRFHPHLIDRSLDDYQRAGVQYLISGYDPAQNPAAQVKYQALFRQLEPLQTFLPTPDHPGPVIRIFKMPQ